MMLNLRRTLIGVANFFDGDFYRVKKVVSRNEIPKGAQRQTDECRPDFDHCYVDQDGGGFTGDDFHGTVYFSVGGDDYLAVSY